MIRGSIKITVVFEDPFWVGIFEQQDRSGYSVARYVFGAEPSTQELYEFLLNNFHKLKFTTPTITQEVIGNNKKNPKRLRREVQKELKAEGSISKAHEALKQELELIKKVKVQKTKEEKKQETLIKFQLKQQKKKKKQRGH